MPSSCDSRAGGPKSVDKGPPKAPEPQEAMQPVDPEDLHTTQPQGFELLLAELILVVSEFLPDADSVCFALTCKDICKLLNFRRLVRHLDKRATETLLCRLERDLPGFIYCFVESKLKRFRTPESKWVCIHRDSFERERYPSIVWFGGIIEFPYCYARLAANYQIFGPQHGIPTSYLEETYEHMRRILGVCWKEELTAKLLNGELFVLFRHTFFHERDDACSLDLFFRTRTIFICPHKTLFRQSHNIPLPLDRGRNWNPTGNLGLPL